MLRAVVEVALETAALGLAGGHQAHGGRADILLLQPARSTQRLALEREAGDLGQRRRQLRRGVEVGAVLEPGDDPTSALHGGPRPAGCGSRPGRAVRRDRLPGLGMREDDRGAGVPERAGKGAADILGARGRGDGEATERCTHARRAQRTPREPGAHEPERGGGGGRQRAVDRSGREPVGGEQTRDRGQRQRRDSRRGHRRGERARGGRPAHEPRQDQPAEGELGGCGHTPARRGEPVGHRGVGVDQQQVAWTGEAAAAPRIEHQRRQQPDKPDEHQIAGCGRHAVPPPREPSAGMQQGGVRGGRRRQARTEQGKREQQRRIARRRQRAQPDPGGGGEQRTAQRELSPARRIDRRHRQREPGDAVDREAEGAAATGREVRMRPRLDDAEDDQGADGQRERGDGERSAVDPAIVAPHLAPCERCEEDRCVPRREPGRAPMRGGRDAAQTRLMARPTLIGLLLLAVAAGCGGSGNAAHNKAGAPVATAPQVLRLQATDAGSPEAQSFATRVAVRSGGTLRVDVLADYPSDLPANEARLAGALRAGRADFGILPARAWPAAGVPAFAALQAPFVLGSYDVARSAMAGPAGDALMHALERADVTPLALVPAELRRVLADKPLDTPQAFRGLRVRIADNPTTAAVLRTLGAEPVQGVTPEQLLQRLERHELDGAETAPIWIASSGYGRFARHLTGYALFDRVDTLVASAGAWERLSHSEQAAIRAAARDTVGFTATLAARDAENLAQLCRGGVRVTAPTAANLRAIAEATGPVRASLRQDPEIAPILAQLEATDGAGPRALPLPEDCTVSTGAGRETGNGSATIPEGTYETVDTVADFEAGGQFGPDWERTTTFTMRIRDGRWVLTQKPDYPDAGKGGGPFDVDGDEVTFREPRAGGLPPQTARWNYFEGRLSFQDVEISDTGLRVILTAHPWRKVR